MIVFQASFCNKAFSENIDWTSPNINFRLIIKLKLRLHFSQSTCPNVINCPGAKPNASKVLNFYFKKIWKPEIRTKIDWEEWLRIQDSQQTLEVFIKKDLLMQYIVFKDSLSSFKILETIKISVLKPKRHVFSF